MKKHFKYLSYVLRHKWFVFLECYKMGIPWLGLIHDWSKFRPGEWIPYVNYFYGDKSKNIKSGRDETGDRAFDFAWLLHQKRNKHHWQWWLLPEDEGGEKIFDIPDKYFKEMLADWKGAGRAQGIPDVRAWYCKNKDKMRVSDITRDKLNSIYG